MARHNDFGRWGEDLAVDFLRRHGFEILARNWRAGRAEVDILARDGDVLVAVEVKTRGTDAFGRPEIFVGRRKIRMLTEAVNAYAEQTGWEGDIRFDIVAIVRQGGQTRIEHIPDAFYWF